mgnify:CR=1 FL=1
MKKHLYRTAAGAAAEAMAAAAWARGGTAGGSISLCGHACEGNLTADRTALLLQQDSSTKHVLPGLHTSSCACLVLPYYWRHCTFSRTLCDVIMCTLPMQTMAAQCYNDSRLHPLCRPHTFLPTSRGTVCRRYCKQVVRLKDDMEVVLLKALPDADGTHSSCLTTAFIATRFYMRMLLEARQQVLPGAASTCPHCVATTHPRVSLLLVPGACWLLLLSCCWSCC